MPVVRGDRVGESRRLNRRSVEAQDFYAAFVACVPDDFGRFRVSPAHVALRMYPRREPTRALLRRVGRLLEELGSGEDALWSTWEVDGVVFGETRAWKATGNRYHRTPEPPSSRHEHQGACLSTAIHRAREWGDVDTATALSIQLKELRDRKRTGAPPGAYREGAPPSPPSPLTTDTPLPPQAGFSTGSSAENGATTENAVASAEEKPAPPKRERVERHDSRALQRDRKAAIAYWIRLGGRPDRRDRRQVWEALSCGHTLDQVRGSISERVREELVAAGRLGPTDAWPPPELSPFEPNAHGPPAAVQTSANDRPLKAPPESREP